MSNKATLRPPFNPEEARYYGSKGGKASVESRKQNGTVRSKTRKALERKVTDPKQLALIKKSGLPIDEKEPPTFLDFLIATTIVREIKSGRFGDLKSLMELLGETNQDEQKENGLLADLIDGLKDEE